MGRKKPLAIAGAAVALVVAVAAIWLMQHPASNNATTNNTQIQSVVNSSGDNMTRIANMSETKPTINLISSSSALPFVQMWVSQYNLENNKGTVNVVYSNTVDGGSDKNGNLTQFLSSNSADIAIIGNPSQSNSSGESLFLPVSPYAVAVVYNIPSFPDVPSGLKLDRDTLGAIMTGNVTYWDDHRIKSQNADANLPHQKIIVVHPSKPESSTSLLAQYLMPATGKTNWSGSSQTAANPGAISALVQKTPFSIGFIDFAYAVQTKMTFGALETNGTKFVEPSIGSISNALRNGTVVGNISTSSSIANATFDSNAIPTISPVGNESYPVTGLYFAAFSNNTANYADNQTAAAVKDFARWMVSMEAQKMLNDVQYPSVYSSDVLSAYIREKAPGPGFEPGSKE